MNEIRLKWFKRIWNEQMASMEIELEFHVDYFDLSFRTFLFVSSMST